MCIRDRLQTAIAVDPLEDLLHGLWVLFSIGAPSARRALDAAEDEIRDRWGSLLWTLQRERWERDSAELWSALSGR